MVKQDHGAQLEQLFGELSSMGGMTEEMLERSIRSVVAVDADMARSVIARDREVDELHRLIETRALSLLESRRLEPPQIRNTIGLMKIATDLERVGDLAKNIAKRSLSEDVIAGASDRGKDISRMGRMVFAQLKRVLDALNTRDAFAAALVWERDEEVDENYNILFRVLMTYMVEDPRTIGACAHLLFMAKNLERIGDHCTNIAETIHFLATGDQMTLERPKADDLPN